MFNGMFVNAYLVDRAYGGPEEGGWYYDIGEFIKGVPYLNGETQEAAESRLIEMLRESGEVDVDCQWFKVYTEETLGADFPEHKPHWDMWD